MLVRIADCKSDKGRVYHPVPEEKKPMGHVNYLCFGRHAFCRKIHINPILHHIKNL